MSVTNLPRSGAAVYIILGGRSVHNTRCSQILVEIEAPFRAPRPNIATTSGTEYTNVTLRTDGQTDGQTPRDGIGLAYA